MELEYLTVGEARALLGISNKTMARLISEGMLSTIGDPLDKRLKLVKRADVEALAARSPKKGAA